MLQYTLQRHHAIRQSVFIEGSVAYQRFRTRDSSEEASDEASSAHTEPLIQIR